MEGGEANGGKQKRGKGRRVDKEGKGHIERNRRIKERGGKGQEKGDGGKIGEEKGRSEGEGDNKGKVGEVK